MPRRQYRLTIKALVGLNILRLQYGIPLLARATGVERQTLRNALRYNSISRTTGMKLAKAMKAPLALVIKEEVSP